MEQMVQNSPEKGMQTSPTVERTAVVAQPVKKVEAMQALLLEVNDIVAEANPAKPGEQWSGSQSTTTGGTTATAQTLSWRDQAIAAIPAPQIMQKQLATHIQSEIETLRKQATHITDLRKPGAAHHFNELQSRIHRLNSLLKALFDSSLEVLKRIFIRVFIDKQTIL
jgi:hypothetical protein